jgi:hypothetical protein
MADEPSSSPTLRAGMCRKESNWPWWSTFIGLSKTLPPLLLLLLPVLLLPPTAGAEPGGSESKLKTVLDHTERSLEPREPSSPPNGSKRFCEMPPKGEVCASEDDGGAVSVFSPSRKEGRFRDMNPRLGSVNSEVTQGQAS